MTVGTEKSAATAVRPFQVEIPDEALEDLRRSQRSLALSFTAAKLKRAFVSQRH